VAAIAAVYGRTIGHGFAFDDQMLVLDNPLVREPLSQSLDLVARRGGGFSYRPVRVLSYRVDHALAGGLAPGVFHASNLVWHAAAALALLSLARATVGSEGGALAAALLFAVHPLSSEAVAYVAGRRDLLCGFFALVALRLWWWFLDLASVRSGDARDAGDAGRRAASVPRRGAAGAALGGAVVAGLLAVGSKETALVVPVLAALLAIVHARRQRTSPSAARARGFRLALALAAVALACVGAAVLLYPDRLTPLAARASQAALAPQPALTLDVLGRYLALALWPARLSADYRAGAYALPATALDASAVAAALALAAVVGAAVWLLARGAVAGAGLLWFLASLLPVAQIVPYAEVIAEHNAYLGLAGLALAAGEGVSAGLLRRPQATAAVAGVVLAALAARTFVRAGDWRDDETLWRATLSVAPGSLRARYNLGVALVQANRLAEARDALVAAYDVAPDDRDVLLALAGVETRLGNHARARDLARRALAERRDARALLALGWAQLGLGAADAAAATFEEAIAAGGPGDAQRGLELARRRRARP